MDGREWLAGYRERLQDIKARAVRAEAELAGVTGTAISRDGAVSVTVNPAGALQNLTLTEHTEGMSRERLAATVLGTARTAQVEAARQAEAAVVPVLGERSEAMNVLRTHLAAPGREP